MFSKRIVLWLFFFVIGKLFVQSNYLGIEHKEFDFGDDNLIFESDDDNLIIESSRFYEFINKYDLVADAQPSLQMITPENTFNHDDTIYELDKLQPFNVFTSDATYFHDGISSDLPKTHLFRIETYEDVVIVKKDAANEIKDIYIVDKNLGRAIEIHSLYSGSGVLATISQVGRLCYKFVNF